MALTVIKNDKGDLIANRTSNYGKSTLLEIYLTDETISNSNYVKRFMLDERLSEEDFHKTIRKDLSEGEEFIPYLSTDPQWNPDYQELPEE